ncbi:hypothetical protein [Geodermatophilus sp. CPCC 205506]|uniref:hypothetical protein n=1 Tax=Geodermatophilus sp. CPCC 205506 TaxID=2936596 RepID=UPI003EEE8A86
MVDAGAVLTAQTTPEAARRAWPRWVAGGAALLVVAVVAVFWEGGPRLLLGVVGALVAGRGALLARSGTRGPGAALVAAGLAAVVVALGAGGLAGWVLLAGVPAGLLTGALLLLHRGGAVRRSGQAALVWWGLVTGLLAVTGVMTTWARAADGAAVVAALGVGLLGVFVLVGAANLRTLSAQPPAAARPAGCAGCACGAGGCGALG